MFDSIQQCQLVAFAVSSPWISSNCEYFNKGVLYLVPQSYQYCLL